MNYLNIDSIKFPTNVSPIINLANYYAKGTAPKIVGQMTDLIQEFTGTSIKEWGIWYLKRHPNAINDATKKIMSKLMEFKDAMAQIDEKVVEQWVKDLVIVKTFVGLKYQEAILKKLAEIKRKNFKMANPEEEAKGIDGFIDDIPVSIKPDTYKQKTSLPEVIGLKIIFYSKDKDGIKIDLSEII